MLAMMRLWRRVERRKKNHQLLFDLIVAHRWNPSESIIFYSFWLDLCVCMCVIVFHFSFFSLLLRWGCMWAQKTRINLRFWEEVCIWWFEENLYDFFKFLFYHVTFSYLLLFLFLLLVVLEKRHSFLKVCRLLSLRYHFSVGSKLCFAFRSETDFWFLSLFLWLDINNTLCKLNSSLWWGFLAYMLSLS
jgi:hypothetical protein